MSVERSSSRESHATSTLASNSSEGSFVHGPAEETSARGSSESPCRAFHPLNFPRDGHEPCADATGSDDFPPKSSGTARSGIDEAMGPWLRPRVGDMLLLAQQTVHMNRDCLLINRRTYLLRMCYCVDKLHFFLLAGCDGSRGYWQSLTKRELNKQHQRYCVSEKSQVPIPL